MTVQTPAVGVLTAIAALRHPVARGWAPPPVVLHHRLGESSYTDVHLVLFHCHDISLCLLTGVGPRFPH
jgi:hypothetical protein